jgi:hypothetical protein
MSKFLFSAALVAFAGSALCQQAGSLKEELRPDSITRLQKLIKPKEGEWRHLRVHWLTDVVAARKKAAAEDKPIIVLRTGGAGYNDPLGSC